MRLVLNSEGWWWVQCLCGEGRCESQRSQRPFLFVSLDAPTPQRQES